jgi:hypothetical protein
MMSGEGGHLQHFGSGNKWTRATDAEAGALLPISKKKTNGRDAGGAKCKIHPQMPFYAWRPYPRVVHITAISAPGL